MSWFLVAILAYLLLAIANIFDKFLVDNVIKNSKAYAFVACVLGSIVFLLSPWLLEWPGSLLFIFNILNGFVFAIALWLLYESLRKGEASRTLVFIGGTTPIFSLLFSTLFFKERFSPEQFLGIIFSLIGVFLIAFLPQKRNFLSRVTNKFKLNFKSGKGGLIIALFSALFYSLYFIGTKVAYSSQTFASAFIWTRLGASIFVLLFLFNSDNRRAIKLLFSGTGPKKNKFLVLGNQVLGSSGFILQNYAIFLGSVVLVNALQGVQYAFILIIGTILAMLAPKFLKESINNHIIWQKAIAVLFISVGLYFLAF